MSCSASDSLSGASSSFASGGDWDDSSLSSTGGEGPNVAFSRGSAELNVLKTTSYSEQKTYCKSYPDLPGQLK